MSLQTARYLIKCLQKVQKNPNKELQENVDYLRNIQEILSIKKCNVKKAYEFDNDALSDLCKSNAAFMTYQAAKSLMAKGQEHGFKNAWDKHVGIELVEAARAHITQYTLRCFIDKINEFGKNSPFVPILKDLASLYAVDEILKHPSGAIESLYVDAKQFQLLRERKYQLLQALRPHILGLVDSFGYHDNNLGSAIGKKDGNPYETLFDWVKKYNSANHFDWSETFQKYIKPLRDMNPKPKL